MRIIRLSVIALISLLSVACSQQEPPTNTAARTTNTGYVSENQQFVEQLNQEVKIDNPDALLSDLNSADSVSK